MSIIKKINLARQSIKRNNLKKAGFNEYSKYDYYTPEQINKLVNDACAEQKLFNKYTLERTDLGLRAVLEVYDLDSESAPETFSIATEIPEIKATNVAQQLGGAVTYSERYLLMIAYDIKDNTLDFDSQKPSETKKQNKNDERPWLTEKQYANARRAIQERKPVRIDEHTVISVDEYFKRLITKFRMKKDYRKGLEEELNSEFNKKLQQ